MAKTTKKTNIDADSAGNSFSERHYQDIVAANLNSILTETGWTQKRLASEMLVSQPMMTDFVHGDRMPSLTAILRLKESTAVQSALPFALDQFLTGDITVESEAARGSEYAWKQEESIRAGILGSYYLYFFDQTMKSADAGSQTRAFRYGVLSLYETVRDTGGVRVSAFARFFKTEADAAAFRVELEAAGRREGKAPENEKTLYKSFDDVYIGPVALIGSHIFIDLFSAFYQDKGLIVLTAPDKKPNSEYIGGLGNNLSVTHGAEHVPVAQKIILSRGIIDAAEEEIASILLYGKVKLDVDGETQELLDLLDALYASKEEGGYLGRFLDAADRSAIIRQRLQQLVSNYVNRTFNGLCQVSKQDDHACYQFLKRHMQR